MKLIIVIQFQEKMQTKYQLVINKIYLQEKWKVHF